MIYECIDINERKFSLQNPLSVKISMDEDAPADSLDVIFPLETKNEEFSEKFPEIKYIKAYNDKSKSIVFDGIVDEQLIKVSASASLLEIHARSYAAVLLDNEAQPQSYCMPSLELLYKNHVKDYGFLGFKGSEESFCTQLTVNKGSSEWEVIENFCNEYLNLKPRVTAARVLDVSGNYRDKDHYFSNAKDGISYTYISEEITRCDLISQVNMRCGEEAEYTSKLENENCKDKDIKRKIYLDCVSKGDSVYSAQQMLEKSNVSSYAVKLICPQAVFLQIYDSASVDDKTVGYIPGLYVSAINYSLSSDMEKCEITLRKKI